MSAERRYIGRSECCGRPVTELAPSYFAWTSVWCVEHPGVLVRLLPVRGELGLRSCDDRCTSARSRDCECQCAGQHHGADYDWREAPSVGVSAVTR